MLIYACISAHGYGHGARTAAVLAELHGLRPDWRLVLSTALPEPFLAGALPAIPWQRRPCRWDVGVVQADALGADPAATLAALEALEAELPSQIAGEAAWLQRQGQPVLLLGDVPPAAARLAQAVGAPLVWLASFGWESIYAPMGPAFAPWAERCRNLYRRGTHLIACPLDLPMPWDLPRSAVGLTSGRPRFSAAEVMAALDLPADMERTALLCFGGLGMDLDPALLGRWPEHHFVVVDPALAGHPRVRLLPAGWRPLDAMPACGRVLTKPGYSTFCEAMVQGLGLHVVHREGFAEAPVLERALRRHARHRLLSQGQLRRGDWQLDLPLLPPTAGPLASDGALQAALRLIELAP